MGISDDRNLRYLSLFADGLALVYHEARNAPRLARRRPVLPGASRGKAGRHRQGCAAATPNPAGAGLPTGCAGLTRRSSGRARLGSPCETQPQRLPSH
jgi:hypothetical protein